jgi:hypothetical protein
MMVSFRKVQGGGRGGPAVRTILAAAVALAALVAGCTSGFPSGARVVASFEVGDLGPDARVVQDFTLAAPAGTLTVGFRTGPAQGAHVALRDPTGQRWSTLALQPGGPCAVTHAAAGTWAVEITTDGPAGFLRKGGFTVRADPGPPGPLHPCRDDAFPGPGENLTLAWRNATLAPGANASLDFAHAFDLRALGLTLVRQADADGNATTDVVDLELRDPEGQPLPATVGSPAAGTWSAHAALAGNATGPRNLTLQVWAVGR